MPAFLQRLLEAGCVVKFWPDNLHMTPVRRAAGDGHQCCTARWLGDRRAGRPAATSSMRYCCRGPTWPSTTAEIRAHSRTRQPRHDLHFHMQDQQSALLMTLRPAMRLQRDAASMEARERYLAQRGCGAVSVCR
jgi:hypothetical protein